MAISFRCPSCNKKLKAHDEHRGVKVKCTGCRQFVVVPDQPGVEPAKSALQPAAAPQAPPPPPADQQVEQLVLAKRNASDNEMDMTPMIDMTFLLLIFFICTASFTLQKSIEIPAPDQEQAAEQQQKQEEEDDDFIIVRIEADDTVWVNDSEASRGTSGRHEVLAKLREAKDEGKGKGPTSLMVMASGDCREETVVMVLDCGTSVGMENVRLAGLDDES
jgi:biopolymer transport protein ExbD